jgi:hypothetical protein
VGCGLGRWRLTRYSTGEAELCDLAQDPLALSNLAKVKRYAGVLGDLKGLYRRYADCRRHECTTALPASYRLTPEQSRRITESQKQATRVFFGD